MNAIYQDWHKFTFVGQGQSAFCFSRSFPEKAIPHLISTASYRMESGNFLIPDLDNYPGKYCFHESLVHRFKSRIENENGACIVQRPVNPIDSEHEIDLAPFSSHSTGRGIGALVLAVLEAACVFAITAAKAGFLLSSVAAFAAGWAATIHRDLFRIPALVLAILGSVINLYLLWKFFRLRNAPAAAWRKKPLTTRERWRMGLVFSMSAATLILAFAEIYLHRVLNHSIL